METSKKGDNFSTALQLVKAGKTVSRQAWSRAGDVKITMHAQYPTPQSKMTEPYLYMKKFYPSVKTEEVGTPEKTEMFPLDLSAESIFAEDWYEVLDVDPFNSDQPAGVQKEADPENVCTSCEG